MEWYKYSERFSKEWILFDETETISKQIRRSSKSYEKLFYTKYFPTLSYNKHKESKSTVPTVKL